MSLIVYCDNGACGKELKKKYINVKFIMFKYENKNKYTDDSLPGSNLTYDDLKKSPHAKIGNFTCKDFESSDKREQIEQIVGKQSQMDINHLDSAYKSNCDIFLTSDYDDIYSKKEELEKLLNFKIFLSPKESSQIEDYINERINTTI